MILWKLSLQVANHAREELSRARDRGAPRAKMLRLVSQSRGRASSVARGLAGGGG